HLLEVRHQPALVDRVAREPAAQMVVDAALTDAVEAELDQVEEGRLAAALAAAPEQFENRGLRKLRRALEPAVGAVDQAGESAGDAVQLGSADHDLALWPRAFGKPSDQRAPALIDAIRLLPEDARDLAQHVGEGGPAVARGLREIGAAPHRLARPRAKHRQRPTALLADEVQRRHVDL